MSRPTNDNKPMRKPVIWARLLLLLPFVAMLWTSSYNTVEPAILGVPFFYWYQMMWVVIGGIPIAIVYWLER